MKKLFKKQWHIAILVVGILLYSILSWGEFFKDIGTKLLERMQEKSTEEIVMSVEDAPSIDSNGISGFDVLVVNPLGKCATFIDNIIERADTEWNKHLCIKSFVSSIDSILTYYVTGEISSGQVVGGVINGYSIRARQTEIL